MLWIDRRGTRAVVFDVRGHLARHDLLQNVAHEEGEEHLPVLGGGIGERGHACDLVEEAGGVELLHELGFDLDRGECVEPLELLESFVENLPPLALIPHASEVGIEEGAREGEVTGEAGGLCCVVEREALIDELLHGEFDLFADQVRADVLLSFRVGDLGYTVRIFVVLFGHRFPRHQVAFSSCHKSDRS